MWSAACDIDLELFKTLNQNFLGFSNTACATPQLNGPTGLSVSGTGDFLTLSWTPSLSNDQDGYNIYRDGELLASTSDAYYEDQTAEISVEYCYYVKAFYNGIGESPSTNESCNSWEVYPPSSIQTTDGDSYVDLSWESPVGGEEAYLEFGDGVLNEVLPFIIGKDDGRIYNATIIKKGKFLSRYSYIEKYIKK